MAIRCKIFGCACITQSDENACWGECVRCGVRHGYLERVYLRRRIEAEEAFNKVWKEYTFEGMTP
jgi:hypothetical protein